MAELIEWPGEEMISSPLDVNSRYWPVEIAEEDQDKAAFSSHHSLFHFTGVPFGLKHAPKTFQRGMDVLQTTVKWKLALVYLDDVLIFSRTPDNVLAMFYKP